MSGRPGRKEAKGKGREREREVKCEGGVDRSGMFALLLSMSQLISYRFTGRRRGSLRVMQHRPSYWFCIKSLLRKSLGAALGPSHCQC